MTKSQKKRSIFIKIRNYFIAGVVVLIPIGVTVYLTLFLVKVSSKILPSALNPDRYMPYKIPGVEIIISVFLITFIGWLSLSFLGRRVLKIFEDILQRIPILRTIYSAITQMIETFTKNQGGVKKVVLVEYPRKGSWAVGFATKENTSAISDKTNHNLVNVFIPTTPNPTSGFLLMFPKEDVIYLNITFEEASKFIVSAGTSDPK